MSHNLVLPGCPHALRQTRTEFTWAWVGRDRFAVLDAYAREYIDPYRPQPLRGKDARNPFLVARVAAENARLDAERAALFAWLSANPSATWEAT